MSDPFLGEIRLAAFPSAPRGWAVCAGQVLAIAQNTALFSLLGTQYGGNGVNTFALPDLRGRVPIHFDSSYHPQGSTFGVESMPLTSAQLAAHTHAFIVATAPANLDAPAGALLAPARDGNLGLDVGHFAQGKAVNTTLAAGAVVQAGGNTPLPLMQPTLALNYIIALVGIFPSRN